MDLFFWMMESAVTVSSFFLADFVL